MPGCVGRIIRSGLLSLKADILKALLHHVQGHKTKAKRHLDRTIAKGKRILKDGHIAKPHLFKFVRRKEIFLATVPTWQR